MRKMLTWTILCWLLLAGLAVFFPAAVIADTEPNDDLAGAEPIGPGSCGGQVNVTDPADFYRFNMSAEKHWRINCTNGYGDDLYFSVLDSNGTPIASSPVTTAHQTWTHRYIQGNANDYYFIKVLRDVNGTVSYTNYSIFLAIEDQNDGGMGGDAGDDIDHASNGTLFTEHEHGLVGDQDLSDFYFVWGAAGQNFSIVFGLEYGLSDPLLRLYDENKTEVNAINASSIHQGHMEFHMTYSGLFYLEAYSGSAHDGTYADYYINISSTPAPPQDTTPPWVTITYPTHGAVLDHTVVNVIGTATDDFGVARVEVGLNAGPLALAADTNPWNITLVLSVGENHVVAVATDTSGHTNSTNITVYVSGSGSANDTQPPWLNFTYPDNGSVVNNTLIEVRGASNDNVAVLRTELSLNDGPWVTAIGNPSWTYNLTLAYGRNRIDARAVDTSGNTGGGWIVVYLTNATGNDTTPPHVYIYEPANGTTLFVPSCTVKWNASDDVGILKVELNVNGGPWGPGTPADDQWTHGTYDAALQGGNNTITARATDFSGNTAIHWIWVLVNWTPPTNDTTPPWVNITFPANWTRLYVHYTNVTGTAGDNAGVAKVEVRIDSGAWSLATGTTNWYLFLSNISQGNRSIQARATDTSGLTATAQIWIYYWPDTSPPRVEVTSVKNNTQVSKRTLVLKGTLSDDSNISRIEVYVNGEKVNVTLRPDGSWEATVKLKEGKNDITMLAYDQAGNSVSSHTYVKYAKPKPQPGFEAPLLAGALVAGLVLLARKRMNR